MNTKEWEKIPNVDMNCFGCGSENHHGLKMTFERKQEKIRSIVIVPDHLRGWSNIVHGGVLSTICDEIMGWAAMHLAKRFMLTKTINTSFLKPVTIGSKLKALGYIKERIDERNAIMAGEIYNEKGQLCTMSIGEFALFTPDNFKKLNIVPNDLISKMAGVFNRG
ncbi:MAG: PaaI family thioesterase [Desulfobacula sp.]|uniref:PaaI family thioesterase n=1 Tax=Desulfobacula sp. TaxID=2593537 RepID=UPI0025BE1BC6|nr:PaaI family thioesterase [Desulfobacula sp.]MCD4721250.1 PaaI family thioesterase [Desulfobacula sp.]